MKKPNLELGKRDFKSKFKGIKLLSASRIDAINTCSWSYFVKYELKTPDENNDGARRGTIIHALCECLIENKQRHYKTFRKIIDTDDVYSVPSVERFVEIYAKKVGLSLDKEVINKYKDGFITNRDFINEMAVVALRCDFYGNDDEISLAEIEYGLDVKCRKTRRRFVIQGFLDKVFLTLELEMLSRVRSGEKISFKELEPSIKKVRIVDYKTSSQKFDTKKMNSNVQALTYQMFIMDLFPSLTPEQIVMDFVFLQFPKQPLLRAPGLSKGVVSGFQEYLYFLYEKINNFTEEDAYANFACDDPSKAMLCGKVGWKSIKVDGEKIQTKEPAWICPLQRPFEYFALTSAKDGKPVRTSKNLDELKKSLTDSEKQSIVEGELKLKKLKYSGCPKFNQ